MPHLAFCLAASLLTQAPTSPPGNPSRRDAPPDAIKLVPAIPVTLKGRINDTSGWCSYRVEVPAGASVHARLTGLHPAWFRVRATKRADGSASQGRTRTPIPTGNPEATFRNPGPGAVTVFFVVDMPGTEAVGEDFRIAFTLQ